jgi:hypothetical protein
MKTGSKENLAEYNTQVTSMQREMGSFHSRKHKGDAAGVTWNKFQHTEMDN